MKKILVLFLLIHSSSFATHLAGGEITWKCAGNGQYIFTLKIYRDCNGIPLLATSYNIHVLGNPIVSTIQVNKVNEVDLTPFGCGISCVNPGTAGNMEEFTFNSDPLLLPGVPPTTGWSFYWAEECCRDAVNNVSGAVQLVIHSTMYSSNIIYPDSCTNSSPVFGSSPESFICLGSPYVSDPIVYDPDNDSLSFAFDYPYDNGSTTGNGGIGGPISYLSPYSVNNPISGNPAINPLNGLFTLNPVGALQIGPFSLVIKVTSYHCGVKTAEIWREIVLRIGGGCSAVISPLGNTYNTPPLISPPPFVDPVTNTFTLFSDTIDVGDTVSFNTNVSELEQNILSGLYQQFYIDAFGSAMDSGSISPYSNCLIPPCAYLDFNTPNGPNILSKSIHFTWITDCPHVIDNCEGYTSYRFTIKATDDECPAHASVTYTATVIIRGLHIVRNGDTLSVITPYTNLQWYWNGIPINGANGNSYIATTGGTYSIHANSVSGCVLTDEIDLQFTGLNNYQLDKKFLIFPNPVRDFLQISSNSVADQKVMLKITNGVGKILEERFVNIMKWNNQIFNVNDFASGIYLLHIISSNFFSINIL